MALFFFALVGYNNNQFEYNRIYYERNQEKIREKSLIYYKIHREKIRKHYENNKEPILEYKRNYMKEHPEKAILYQYRYKSKLKERARLDNNINHNIIIKANPILEFDD